MFCKASLFAVAVALLAVASPVVNDGGGIRIALPKRASLTKADGSFDPEAARIHTAKIIKYAYRHYIVL